MSGGDSCGFCRYLAHLISIGMYRFVFGILLICNLGIAVFWMSQSMSVRDETPFRFGSVAWPTTEFAMGLLMLLVTLFGCFSTAFRGNPVHNQNVYRFLTGLVGIIAMLLGVTFFAIAGDKEAIAGMLDFGWSSVYGDEHSKDHIRAAQAEFDCCGFYTAERDRSVQPCPTNARSGCEKPLLEAYTSLLGLMGTWLITGLGLALVTVFWLYCYEEGYYYEMMKQGKDVYEHEQPPQYGENMAEPEVPLGTRRRLDEFAELYKHTREDPVDEDGMDDALDAGVFVQIHRDGGP